jgi:hypothetical protein
MWKGHPYCTHENSNSNSYTNQDEVDEILAILGAFHSQQSNKYYDHDDDNYCIADDGDVLSSRSHVSFYNDVLNDGMTE